MKRSLSAQEEVRIQEAAQNQGEEDRSPARRDVLSEALQAHPAAPCAF